MALKKYRVLRPVAVSGRQEVGTVLVLDEEFALSYAPGYLELLGDAEETTQAGTQTDDQTTGEGEQTQNGEGSESASDDSQITGNVDEGSVESTNDQASHESNPQTESADASGSESSDQTTETQSGEGSESGQATV